MPVLGLPQVRVGSLSLETLELVGIGIAVDKIMHVEVSLAIYEATRVFLSLTDFIAPQPICHVSAEHEMLGAEITLCTYVVIQGLQASDRISLRLLVEDKDAGQASKPHMKVTYLQLAFRVRESFFSSINFLDEVDTIVSDNDYSIRRGITQHNRLI